MAVVLCSDIILGKEMCKAAGDKQSGICSSHYSLSLTGYNATGEERLGGNLHSISLITD